MREKNNEVKNRARLGHYNLGEIATQQSFCYEKKEKVN